MGYSPWGHKELDMTEQRTHCYRESFGGGGLVAQSCPTLVIPWTEAHQAPLSMEFSRQECWSGLPFPSPGDLPNPGIEPRSPTLQVDSLPSEPPGSEYWSPRILEWVANPFSKELC